jgi:hypothetical protein
MKKLICAVATLLVISFALSCGLVTGKGDAEKVAKSLLNERIEKGGFGSDTYYSEYFWKAVEREKWENLKKLVDKAVGNLKSYKLKTWNVTTQAKTNDLSGTIVKLVYDTVYEKGNGTETIILHRPIAGKTYTIVGHYFNSPEIQKLLDKGIEKAVSGDQL